MARQLHLTLLFALAVSFGAVATGCESLSNLTVNCQVGLKNADEQLSNPDDEVVAGCQFTNTSRSATAGCVRLHLTDPESGDTYESERLCSGQVEPGATTDAILLDFGPDDRRTVAESCVEMVDGERQFQCKMKVEEVALAE